MLKLFRRNTKRIIWVLIISIVLWGVSSTFLAKVTDNKYVGEVSGKKIKANTFLDIYKIIYFSPRIQALLREEDTVNRKMLEDSVFQHIALKKEAKRMNIKVTDNDVRAEIARRFSPNGAFDSRLYKRWVNNVTGQSLRHYEEGVRDELYVQKLIRSITDTIKVSDSEIKDFFYRENRKLKVQYLMFSSDAYKDDIQHTHDDLVAFYQQNINTFMTDKKFTFEYIIFSPQDFIDSVTITENELVSYFERNKEQFLREGTTDIPIFDDVKEEIRTQLTERKSRSLAYAALHEFNDAVTDASLFRSVSQERNYTIISKGAITMSQVIESIGWSDNIEHKFNTLEPRRLHVIETNKGFILIHLQNIEKPQVIDFKTAESDVKSAYVEEEAFELMHSDAVSIHDKIITTTPDFNTILSNSRTNLLETDFFSANDTVITDKRTTNVVFDTLYKHDKNYISDPIVINKHNVAIFKLIDIWDPPPEEYTQSKADIEKKLLEFKKFFELQAKLSAILSKANIKKYPTLKDVYENR